jgi:hypothetical protein
MASCLQAAAALLRLNIDVYASYWTGFSSSSDCVCQRGTILVQLASFIEPSKRRRVCLFNIVASICLVPKIGLKRVTHKDAFFL